jgi:hypothetical protein
LALSFCARFKNLSSHSATGSAIPGPPGGPSPPGAPGGTGSWSALIPDSRVNKSVRALDAGMGRSMGASEPVTIASWNYR